jgi:hypothetical protein
LLPNFFCLWRLCFASQICIIAQSGWPLPFPITLDWQEFTVHQNTKTAQGMHRGGLIIQVTWKSLTWEQNSLNSNACWEEFNGKCHRSLCSFHINFTHFSP